MKTEEIRELAEILDDFGLTCISVKEGDSSVKLERKPSPIYASPAGFSAAQNAVSGTPEEASELASASGKEGVLINSPMVGVFYTGPSPDSEPFVTEGSRVDRGDVLCIVEAMKLMNEITSEYSGVIVQVLAENGQVVEAGQPLFRMEVEK